MTEKGWHYDPHNRFQARWHSGKKWTKHVSHFGAVGKDPIGRIYINNKWVAKWSIILTILLIVARYYL